MIHVFIRCDIMMTSQLTYGSFWLYADWKTITFTYLVGIVMVTYVVLGSVGGMATLSALSAPGTASAADATSAADTVPVSGCRQKTSMRSKSGCQEG